MFCSFGISIKILFIVTRKERRHITQICHSYLCLALMINCIRPEFDMFRKRAFHKEKFDKRTNQLPTRLNANCIITYPVFRNPGSLELYFRSVCDGHGGNDMRYEWLRLRSFSNCCLSSCSPVRLARSGFYYTGVNQVCRCFSCGASNSEWRDGNVTGVHRRLSPNCRHLHEINETNVPIGSRTCNTRTPAETSNTAHCNESSESACTNSVPRQRSGRGLCNKSTTSQQGGNECQENDRHLSNIDQPANSERHHVQRQSNVPTSCSGNDHRRQQNVSDNSATSAEERRTRLKENLEPLGINFDRPRYPSYAILATRISSFQNWPAHMTQTPRELSTAGFLYAGYGDYVRCFFCGGGLRNWEHDDDPWVEHARWFPKCAFLLQNKGKSFVAMVQQLHNEDQRQNEPSSLPNQRNVSGGEASITHLPVAIQVHEMGYTWDKIKISYLALQRTCQGEVSVTDLVEQLLSAGNNSTYSATSMSQTGKNSTSSTTPRPQTGNDLTSSRPQTGNNSTSFTTQTPQTGNNENSNDVVGAEENQAACIPSTAAEELPQLVDNLSLTEETRSLIEENRQLREQRLCRICMDEDVSIAFLPCGHLCCCSHCAPAMRKCPICREFIKGTVKTYSP